MKSMILASASAVMFASAASAGEPVRLSDTQLDGVTAAFRLAIGGSLAGSAGGGTATSRLVSSNLNKVDSKASQSTSSNGASSISATDLVWSEQKIDTSATGSAGSISLGISAGAAVFVP